MVLIFVHFQIYYDITYQRALKYTQKAVLSNHYGDYILKQHSSKHFRWDATFKGFGVGKFKANLSI
jgi:hypothetical protein